MRNPTVIGAGAYGTGGGLVVVNPYPTYALQAVAIDVVEGSPVTFTVLRSGALGLAASVDWAITGGTPADFGGSLPSGHAVFGVGATTFDVSLPTTGNAIVDNTRSFTVQLSNPGAGGVLGAPSSLAGTIADDDTAALWALYPTWSAVANAHVEVGAPSTTTPTQTAKGVTIHEEASGTTGAVIELWWKQSFPADHDFTFTTEYVRSAMPGTARSLILFWDTVGDGTTGKPASVPDWTSLVLASTAHATGTYLIVDQSTNKAQLWTFDRAADAQVGTDFAVTLTQGVRYALKVQRVGTTVTLTVADTAAGTSVVNSWTDPSVQRGTADGYFGLRTRGVLCTVENDNVSDDGVTVVPPAGFPTAPKSARITAWELTKDNSGSATGVEGVDETAGFELKGGPKDLGDANDGKGAVGLVSLAQVSLPGTLQFDYKPLHTFTSEAPNTTNGVYSQIDFYRLNSGSGNLKDLGTLSAGEYTANYSPNDNYYSNNFSNPSRVVGGRFSFDTHSYNGGGDNQVRLRFILPDGTVPSAIGGTQTFDFHTPGGWTTLEVGLSLANSNITVTATYSDGNVTTETYADSKVASLVGSGPVNVGLMCYAGRDSSFRNVSWTDGEPGGGGGGGGGPKAPFYVPNLAGKTAFPIANNADLTTWLGKPSTTYATQYGLVAKGVNLTARTVTTVATKTNPCYIIANRGSGAPSTWTSSDHENFTNRASVVGLTFGAAAKFVWYDGFIHKPGGGQCVLVVGTDSFTTRGWFQRGTSNSGAYTGAASYRTRIGCCLFDSDGGRGDKADINQDFSKNVSTNPDYWDTYGNAHVSITTIGTPYGECLYAQPGIDSGDPAVNPPGTNDYSQHNSFWRGCYVRTNSKLGIYAKHIPNFVECDGAFSDSSGIVGGSHTFAYRGGSSVGGRMLYLRAQNLTFSPGGDSATRQSIAVQSWYHEVGWCEAVGGVINIYCFCPHCVGTQSSHRAVFNGDPGFPGDQKPLQQARYCDVHHCKGLLCLGASRDDISKGVWVDDGIHPVGKVQNVVISAHDGTITSLGGGIVTNSNIVDDAGNLVHYNPTTGAITSTHTWIETTGANACKIFATDPNGRAARPANLAIPRSQVGPGCPNTTPWDGVGQWPKLTDYGSTVFVNPT